MTRARAVVGDVTARARAVLTGSPYVDYLYSYPHKTAHRPLDPAVALDALWAPERRDALFLYVHVPFCATRCGYCNLFTQVGHDEARTAAYLAALARQSAAVARAIAPARFARLAIGGGTPSLLSVAQLERLFDLLAVHFDALPARLPTSFELAPDSTSPEHVALLADRGVERVSIGVQSFVESELSALGRRQSAASARRALDLLRTASLPLLNIDLIYGVAGQTEQSFERSLREALRWQPEELFLYPLYVRPLTGLGRRQARPREQRARWDEERLTLYRLGRDLLAAEGYEQASMRSFRRPAAAQPARPAYRCQADGMVGLGCGARSYTESLHYSSEYAVEARGVAAIVEAWSRRGEASFAQAEHGVRLDEEDRRRRHAIMGLLTRDGLELEGYRARFGADALADVTELAALCRLGLAEHVGAEERLRLTPAGLERSDAVGPFLRSARVDALMRDYRPR